MIKQLGLLVCLFFTSLSSAQAAQVLSCSGAIKYKKTSLSPTCLQSSSEVKNGKARVQAGNDSMNYIASYDARTKSLSVKLVDLISKFEWSLKAPLTEKSQALIPADLQVGHERLFENGEKACPDYTDPDDMLEGTLSGYNVLCDLERL